MKSDSKPAAGSDVRSGKARDPYAADRGRLIQDSSTRAPTPEAAFTRGLKSRKGKLS